MSQAPSRVAIANAGAADSALLCEKMRVEDFQILAGCRMLVVFATVQAALPRHLRAVATILPALLQG